MFQRRIAPEFGAHPFVHQFGKGFGEAVGKGSDHDGIVIVVFAVVFLNQSLNADARCHGKPADVIRLAAFDG